MRCGATAASSASGKHIVRRGKRAAIRDGSDRQTANERAFHHRFRDELDKLGANFMLRSTDSRPKSRQKHRPIVPLSSTKIAGEAMLEAHDFCASTTPIPQSAALAQEVERDRARRAGASAAAHPLAAALSTAAASRAAPAWPRARVA
jgi:hypothetical protein